MVRTNREVLFSPGVIQSPQILELSGLRFEVLLKKHGIPTIISNPYVGENLQDHVIIARSWQTVKELKTWKALCS